MSNLNEDESIIMGYSSLSDFKLNKPKNAEQFAVYKGIIYDISQYLRDHRHPGGNAVLEDFIN